MKTLLELLPHMSDLGDREALRFWNGYRTWTWSYSDLYECIGRFVGHLDAAGMKKGDRLLIWSENRPEWVAVFWACLVRGIQVVPIDSRSSLDLVGRIREETRAVLLVHGSSPGGEEVSKSDFLSLAHFPIGQIHDLPRNPEFAPSQVDPDDIVEIVYTSGTTAEPKGVVHRHRNICANLNPIRNEIDRYKKWAHFFQPIRFLVMLPLGHMFGQAMGIFIPLLLDGAAVFMSSLHPGAIQEAVQRQRVSVLVCVPRILEGLRADVERTLMPERQPPGTARISVARRWWHYRRIHRAFGWKFWAFVVGGAPLEPEAEEFWSKVGLMVLQGYGLTETSPVVAVNHPFHARRGTLGRVVCSQEIKIAEDGEILVRGSSVVSEYVHQGARFEPVSDPDGWFHTGDIGRVDQNGQLVYRGRKKDIIVTPDGQNVYPEDIEAALAQIEGIRDSTVVPVHGPDGERVHAALILESPANDTDDTNDTMDAASLIEQANQRLEPGQRIRSWSIWPDDDFPRTPSTLKVKRRLVGERISGDSTEASAEPAKHLDEMISRLAGRSTDRLNDSLRLNEDLGLSSLERIDLLSWLEVRYDLSLDETEFSGISTLGDLKSWVQQARGRTRSGHQVIRDTGSPPERPAQTRVAPPRWSQSFPMRRSRNLVQALLVRPLFGHYIALRIQGLENLDAAPSPVIFAANHASHLDTAAIVAGLPSPWRGKLAPAMLQEWFTPYFTRSGSIPSRLSLGSQYYLACGLFNAYPLPQHLGQVREALRYTGELLGRGYCPLVYPEGKRTPNGSLQPFQPGIGLMALRLHAPIVPLHLEGMFEIMSLHDSWPKAGPARLKIGKPLTAEAGEDYIAFTKRLETTFRHMS